jgi:hypothetical protein
MRFSGDWKGFGYVNDVLMADASHDIHGAVGAALCVPHVWALSLSGVVASEVA